jgi:hypothetical protein
LVIYALYSSILFFHAHVRRHLILPFSSTASFSEAFL